VDEYHMFVAKAAALRSCDLSRQVGATIVDRNKSIVSTGCNEVPYPDGGIFYEGREGGIPDNRDYTKGHDPNWIEIQRTLIELIEVLKSAGKITDDDESSKIADHLLYGRYKELMSNARIRNLIEFGRVVHAEMHALSQAATVGRSVKGATLYCTTFPCHGCARHIIAAGISEVVFIEPYPKSLTEQLYDGEIEMVHKPLGEGDSKPVERVRFRPFHGVAPVLYQRVFSYRERKDQYGTIATWNPRSATPVGAILGVERPSVETAASSALAAILEPAKALYAQKKGETGDGGAVTSESAT
jgi:cytidine deaminase